MSGFSSSRPRFFPLFFCRHHSRVISKTPPSALKRNESDAGPGASRGMAGPRAGAPPTTFQGETALQQPRSSQGSEGVEIPGKPKARQGCPGPSTLLPGPARALPPRGCRRARRSGQKPQGQGQEGSGGKDPNCGGDAALSRSERLRRPQARARPRGAAVGTGRVDFKMFPARFSLEHVSLDLSPWMRRGEVLAVALSRHSWPSAPGAARRFTLYKGAA